MHFFDRHNYSLRPGQVLGRPLGLLKNDGPWHSRQPQSHWLSARQRVQMQAARQRASHHSGSSGVTAGGRCTHWLLSQKPVAGVKSELLLAIQEHATRSSTRLSSGSARWMKVVQVRAQGCGVSTQAAGSRWRNPTRVHQKCCTAAALPHTRRMNAPTTSAAQQQQQ